MGERRWCSNFQRAILAGNLGDALVVARIARGQAAELTTEDLTIPEAMLQRLLAAALKTAQDKDKVRGNFEV